MAKRSSHIPGDSELLAAGGRDVPISNPDKVLFPEAGYTKRDLARYYLAVAEGALRGAGGQPNVLVRYPNGIHEEFFYQKRAPASRPPWIEIVSAGPGAARLRREDLARLVAVRRRLEVWSGGQTGVDRAALDAALDLGLPIGGWVPRGRLAEDGQVPARYGGLTEADSPEYAARTRLNVRDTDATLVLRMGAASGGTLETMEAARGLGRPMLDVDLEIAAPPAAAAATIVAQWLEGLFTTRSFLRLNVAGPRASQAPESYARAKAVLDLIFAQPLLELDPDEKTLRSS